MGVYRKHLLFAIGFGLACGAALLLLPRLLAILSFYLGYDSIENLFFARLGLSGAVSDFIAGALVFFFPMATYVLFVNILAVWSGRANLRRVVKVFAAYAFIYLLPAGATALHDTFGAPAREATWLPSAYANSY